MLNYQLKIQQFFKNLKVSQAVQHKAFLSARSGGSIEMQTTFLGKGFYAFQGEVPISKEVQDHRYCEETGVMKEYQSGSTIQEFSLLSTRNFSPPQI